MRTARDPGREAAREAVADHDRRSERAAGRRIWSSATSPPSAPNRLWVGDFTYLRCWEGVRVLRVRDRRVLADDRRLAAGRPHAHRPRARRAADGARARASPALTSQLVAHTDAGVAIHRRGLHAGARRPPGAGVGRHRSATPMTTRWPKRSWTRYKTELIADRVWRTRAQLELATVEWVALVQPRPAARGARRHPAGRVRAAPRRQREPDSGQQIGRGISPRPADRAYNASARSRSAPKSPSTARSIPSTLPLSETLLAKAAPQAGRGTRATRWPLRRVGSDHSLGTEQGNLQTTSPWNPVRLNRSQLLLGRKVRGWNRSEGSTAPRLRLIPFAGQSMGRRGAENKSERAVDNGAGLLLPVAPERQRAIERVTHPRRKQARPTTSASQLRQTRRTCLRRSRLIRAVRDSENHRASAVQFGVSLSGTRHAKI